MAGATLQGTDKRAALPPPPGATAVSPAGKQARQPAPSGTCGPPQVPPLATPPYSGSWLHNPAGCLATLLVACPDGGGGDVCTRAGVRVGWIDGG